MQSARVRTQYDAVMAADVVEGLSASPKWLSAKYFYDAEGSRLFDAITELPEYYVTRTEAGILAEHAGEMIAAAGEGVKIVELGAGSATKTTLLLRAALERSGAVDYYPMDVSATALDEAQERLERTLPGCRVHPIVDDYQHGITTLPQMTGRKLVMFIGSSIGNFEPLEGSALLAHLRRHLGPEDAILLGTDMRKPEEVLVPAYDDAQGVTAAFNRNILAHINRALDADFAPERFAHRAVWNDRLSRIEMHLESIGDQVVHIAALGRSFRFADGETIHTENSYKFSPAMLDGMLRNAGLRRAQAWCDEREWFTVQMLRSR